METKTSLLTNSMNQSRMRLAFLLIPLALTCFGLSPQARALCQEFCNDSLANTFLGTSAGANNTTGNNNTAVGFLRSISTQPATTTRPTVFKRSQATQPATTTRPSVLLPSF